MLSKDDILDSILLECRIVNHLYGEIPEGGLAYRQSPSQRSNLELLQYLSYCGIGGAAWVLDVTRDSYAEWSRKHGGITWQEFPAAMERQVQALTERFEALQEADLERETKLPMGSVVRVEQGLIEMPLKWMTAYRMQLFAGIKASGNSEIWTPDCWAGVSMPRPASSGA